MMTDFVALGDLLKLGAFLIIGAGFVYSIKGDVRALKLQFESDVRAIMQRLSSAEDEIHELRKVMITLARQDERQNAYAGQMNAMDQRSLLLGKRVDEAVERMNKFIDRAAMHT